MYVWERGLAEGGVGTGRCVDGIGGESAVDNTKEHKNKRMRKNTQRKKMRERSTLGRGGSSLLP
jgi:hypothetical protein